MKKGSFFKHDFVASLTKSFATDRYAGYERNDYYHEQQA